MKPKTLSLLVAVLLAPTFWVEAANADIVVVVSARNPVASLTRDQISDIFLGECATLPSGEPAMPLELPEGALSDEFHSKITRKSPTQLKAYWSKMVFSGRARPPKQAQGQDEARKIIASNPNAIGYIDRATLDGSVKVVFH